MQPLMLLLIKAFANNVTNRVTYLLKHPKRKDRCKYFTNNKSPFLAHFIGAIKFIVFLVFTTICDAQSPEDSAKKVVTNLTEVFKKGDISESKYLDSINALMRSIMIGGIHINNRDMRDILATYRETIWENKRNEERKSDYYSALSNQAQLAGNLGEMRYYGEKLNELEEKKTNQPSVAALTIIADYYNTLWSYANSKELYITHKNFIASLPEKAANGILNLRQIVQVTIMLDKFGEAIFELNDTINGQAIEVMLTQIDSIANRKYPRKYYELAHIEFAKLHVALCKGNGLKSGKLLREAFQQLEKFMSSEHTPDNLKEASSFSITDNKIILFLDENNTDSATYYLKIFTAMMGPEPGLHNKYMLQKYKSRLLYEQGLYKQSADTLIDAMLASESIRKDIVKDVNEMLYAQAKAEDQQLLLQEANNRRAATEKNLLIAGIVIVVLVLSGLLVIQYVKRKQRDKFLQFKLNIARNLHDETNPALLYAKALAKTSRPKDETDTKTALEQHIEHTMQVIRSLSHDLKSDKLKTINDLSNEVKETLDKLNADNSFSSNISVKADGNRLLSHHQFSNLKAIVQEAIANTIKHASFSAINIGMRVNDNKLSVYYSDNGTGWESFSGGQGIGIENMKERVTNINGDWSLTNNYPNGYHLDFSVLLR